MPGSNFSIINGADGVTKIPVSTPVNDTNGNTVVAHLAMTNVAGVAMPVSASNPEPVNITNFPATQAVSGSVSVSNLPVTQAVSAAALPLPAGAATAAAQPALNGDGGALTHVTNFPATQPISGSVNVSNFPSSQAVSLTALPALATGGNTIGAVTQSGSWNVNLGSALPAGSNAIGAVNVSNFPASQPVSLTALPALATGGNTIGAVTQSGSWNVSLSSALPSGLNAIGSVSVSNFPSSQPVSGTFWPSTQPVSLTALPALAAGGNTIGAVIQSGAWNVSLGGALPAGSNAIGSVNVSNFPATQSVSVASMPLPAGAATSANQAPPGTAGSPSVAGLSVQGIAGGTPQPVAAVNGVSVTATAVTLTPGSSTQVIGANIARKSLAVFFLSATATGYLTPSTTATATNGIPLGVAPSGGISLGQAYSWEGSGVPTGSISMLCAGAASVIVWEGQ